MKQCLLTLIATPELEERLIDWLLMAEHEGFTTARCDGHGVASSRLSTAEQVAGRQRRIVFWLQLPESEVEAVIAGLAERFAGAGLHYWVTPVLAAGRIESPGAEGLSN